MLRFDWLPQRADGPATTSKMIRKMLGELRLYLFPPFTRRDALEIALRKLAQPSVESPVICHGRKPPRFKIYNEPAEPCWWIKVPWGDGRDGQVLRGSRVMVVGRRTGIIYYDGSANDEG